MPYIKQEDREKLDQGIDQLCDMIGTDPAGKLNYIFTRLLLNKFGINVDPRYNNINNAIGVLECAKLELYRRVAEYERVKSKENGDVAEFIGFDHVIQTRSNGDGK